MVLSKKEREGVIQGRGFGGTKEPSAWTRRVPIRREAAILLPREGRTEEKTVQSKKGTVGKKKREKSSFICFPLPGPPINSN